MVWGLPSSYGERVEEKLFMGQTRELETGVTQDHRRKNPGSPPTTRAPTQAGHRDRVAAPQNSEVSCVYSSLVCQCLLHVLVLLLMHMVYLGPAEGVRREAQQLVEDAAVLEWAHEDRRERREEEEGEGDGREGGRQPSGPRGAAERAVQEQLRGDDRGLPGETW